MEWYEKPVVKAHFAEESYLPREQRLAEANRHLEEGGGYLQHTDRLGGKTYVMPDGTKAYINGGD